MANRRCPENDSKKFPDIFWIDEENDKVQVMAIIYNKRDQIKQLQNLDRLE